MRLSNTSILCILLFFVLIFVSCGDNKDKGKVIFELQHSGTPATPYIAVPDEVNNFKMELFKLDTVLYNDEDNSETESTSGFASKEESTSEPTSSPSPEAEETKPANYYSITSEYNGGDLEMEMDDIQVGAWILKVSAMDSTSTVLGHVQQSINVNKNKKVTVKGWLLPGSAPSGFIYTANTTSKTLTRVSLADDIIDTLKLTESPAYLFLKNNSIGAIGDTIFATTGGPKLLTIKPVLSSTECTLDSVPFPTGGTMTASGTTAAVSFYKENGVRFFDYQEDFSNVVTTGTNPEYISNVVDNKAWVVNQNDMTIAQIDLSTQSTVGDKVGLGHKAFAAAQNKDGSRIWTIGGPASNSTAFMRVVDPTGELIRDYTADLINPTAICIVDDVVCVADSGARTVFFFGENEDVEELERLKLSEGTGNYMFSDGQRIYYLLSDTNKIAVIDITTYALIKTYSVGSGAKSMVLQR